MQQYRVTVMDGFKFGMGFTLGSLVISFIILPIFACVGFLVMTVLGGSLAAILGQ